MSAIQNIHIAKTITWRLVGTLDTIAIAWIITGSPYTGIKIGGVELISKMILYYTHERVWFKYSKKIDSLNEKI